VKWAIQQGIADPKRVCIAGASYGGYATLMGLARNPELFKCGVNWVGVTDISLLYQFSWSSDSSKEWRQYGLPILVGDKVKDAEKIAANSPVNNVHLITQPVLLAYGEKDRRVPIKHGEIFLNAIKKTNNHVEWIEYPEEGHGWSLVKNRVDFWNKVDVFLEKNLLEQQ
jgi:dipeptidyl aminopeptidase/acylaminoacyl peptidase